MSAGELSEALRATAGLEVRFREPLAPHAQRLMDALGVRVVIDPRAPKARTAIDPNDYNRPGRPSRQLP